MKLLSHDSNPEVLSTQIQAMSEHDISPEDLLVLAPNGTEAGQDDFQGVKVQSDVEDPMVELELSEEDADACEEAIRNGEYVLFADESVNYSDEFFE